MSDYVSFKNHLHNTLGITKKQIREMVDKAIYKIVERRVAVFMETKFDVKRLVDDEIKTRAFNLWGESEEKLSDYIKRHIVTELIDGVKIKAELVHTKKAMTPPSPRIEITKRVRKS